MKYRLAALLFSVLLSAILQVRIALAQVPPHPPGTICFTQSFWCWAQPPGPPNTACVCTTPNGVFPGIRG
jgi:hypothetical protein